jgi:hypothetical protein
MINPIDSSLEECAANKGYNILYQKDGKTFYSNKIKIKCKMKNDGYNTTHSSYSYIPTLFGIKKRGEDKNSILTIKHSSKSIKEMKDKLKEFRISNFSYDKDTVKDVKRVSRKIAFLTLEGDYWVHSNDDKKIAYDDNTNVKNIVYNIDKKLEKNGWYDVVGVYLQRNFINNNGDNLTKKISTLQITSIYDVRKFDFELYCAAKVKYNDTSTDVLYNETTITGSVSSSVNSETGAVNGVSSTLGGEQNPSVSSGNTGVTEVQRTIYRIKTYIKANTKPEKEEIIKWNQQFYSVNDDGYNTDALSAVFAIGSKFTSDVSISNKVDGDFLNIDFDIYWSGDLSGMFLDKIKGNPDTYLYIKMPNKLIYQIPFKLNDFAPSTSECEVDNTYAVPPTVPEESEEGEGEEETLPSVKGVHIANNQPGIAKIYIDGIYQGELTTDPVGQTYMYDFVGAGVVKVVFGAGQWTKSSFVSVGFVGERLNAVNDWGNNTRRTPQEDSYWIYPETDVDCSGSIQTENGTNYVTINVEYTNDNVYS